MDRKRKLCCLGTLMAVLAGTVVAAPGVPAESLEAASLQLGALQAQAQYAPSALQGARAASRSAASCLVTAVQYTHGQQIWRADPCEFCLCLDGEMFCWWQECPPEAPRPCPGGQPYSLCGNNSTSMDQHPPPPPPIHKIKRIQLKKATTTSTTPLVTTNSASTSDTSKPTEYEEDKKLSMKKKASSKDKKKKVKLMIKDEASSNYTTMESSSYETQTETFEGTMEPSKESSASLDLANNNGTETSRTACLVMGVEYQIGQTLPSTGSCLVCRCSEGGSSGARVSCAPRGCAPMDAAALTDDPESF